LRELLSGGATGFQHDFRDLDDAAARVRSLWEDVTLPAMRSQVRSLYEELFSEPAYAADLAGAGERIADRRS